ncbi:helix-turn-helix transcriptional regulator [Streptococcus plurextorum]|uniref:helix-turn-helix transcriptional regulator n=1 Tax=Streptococcus plurextorum TaxID=456876 RepID=UPI0004114D55|nr:AraC family transcriptional regulator [Streptococcus plurextorum]
MKQDTYLLKYLANKLKTTISVYQAGQRQFSICTNKDLYDSYSPLEENISNLLLSVSRLSEPRLISLNTTYCFVVISHKDYAIIIGPLKTVDIQSLKYQFTITNIAFLDDSLVPVFSISDIVEYAILLNNTINIFEMTEADVFETNINFLKQSIKTDLTNRLYHRLENGEYHNSYSQERREQHAIETGNLIKLRESWQEVYTGKIGILSDDELRHYRNLGIVIITLASRSAMRGGAQPEICYSMSDNYIQKIEKMDNINMIFSLIHQAEIEYTLLVKQTQTIIKGTKNESLHPFVIKSKEYIVEHLHKPITLSELANAIPCSASYLVKLFKTNLNLSIQEHITKERCRYAEDLLAYSNKSISDIATTLGYTSQSYFSKVFKKETGYSPLNYRAKFRI